MASSGHIALVREGPVATAAPLNRGAPNTPADAPVRGVRRGRIVTLSTASSEPLRRLCRAAAPMRGAAR